LQRINHPNIIRLRKVYRLPEHIALVLDYADAGELFEYVKRMGNLKCVEIRSIMIQIFSGTPIFSYLVH
jgi:serine/threonine protein kinase